MSTRLKIPATAVRAGALAITLAVGWFATPAGAAEALLPGDPAKGKAAHDKQCTSCHVQMFGGDGSKIYTRKDRKIKTVEGLMGQVKGCNAQVGAKFSKDDVDNVVHYLNTTYYKF